MRKFQQRPDDLTQTLPVQMNTPKQASPMLQSAGSVQRDRSSPQESFADFQARLGVPVQAKLTVTPAGDKYEQEADAVADQVMQTMRVQRMDDEEMMMQRMDDEEMMMQRMDDEEMMLQRQADFTGGGVVGDEVEADIQSARGGGQAMPDGVRSPLESAFGADFSNVRVHNDSTSHALNRSVQAKAFTTGNDIFFGKGSYSPQSESGQRLIAHELTHVVQQGAATPSEQKKTLNDTKITPQQNAPLSLQRGAIKDKLNESGNAWNQFEATTGQIKAGYLNSLAQLYTSYRSLRPAAQANKRTQLGIVPAPGSFDQIHDNSVNAQPAMPPGLAPQNAVPFRNAVKDEVYDRAVRFSHWTGTAHESAERIYDELQGAIEVGMPGDQMVFGINTDTEPDMARISVAGAAQNRLNNIPAQQGAGALESKRVSSQAIGAVDGHVIAASNQIQKRAQAGYQGALIAYIHVANPYNTYPFTPTEFVQAALKDNNLQIQQVTNEKKVADKVRALINANQNPNVQSLQAKLIERITDKKPFPMPQIQYRINSTLFGNRIVSL